jgi:D-threo-aldose 1-dehydrogenase
MYRPQIRPFRDIIPDEMLPVGFGCGGLCDRLTRKESLRLLEVALDCGIRYFDTARMYGLGRAERVLGELTQQNRRRIIIASKVGIMPADRSFATRLTSRMITMLHRAVPGSEQRVPRPRSAQIQLHAFSIKELRNSVETSLRQLRTDYLDILLLHECTSDEAANPAVFDFLVELKKSGKIRAFGIATGIEETIQILRTSSVVAPVVQIPNTIMEMNLHRFPPEQDRLTIIHSSLQRIDTWVSLLSSNPALKDQWTKRLQIDLGDRRAIARLFLAQALYMNRGGVVLFSSTRTSNIQLNVEVATTPFFEAAQLDAFNSLAAEANVAIRP